MGNGFYYYVHGFTLHSEIECPELLPGAVCTPDIRIRLGSLAHIPPDEDRPWKSLCIEDRHMLLNIKGVGRFFVRDGREIIADPVPGTKDRMLRLYLLGSALGCIIHQRGLLPLHANAFLHAGKAVLVLAHSGTGKSTLAAAMKNRGCRVLADDVCAVKIVPGDTPMVFPGIPQIKLWKDAAAHLGEDVSTMRQVMCNQEKYSLPILEPLCGQSMPIKAIYILHACEETMPSVHDMTRLEKIRALRNHTYRKGMVAKLDIEAENLEACAALAEYIHMRRVFRPRDGFLLNELADLLEKDLQ